MTLLMRAMVMVMVMVTPPRTDRGVRVLVD